MRLLCTFLFTFQIPVVPSAKKLPSSRRPNSDASSSPNHSRFQSGPASFTQRTSTTKPTPPSQRPRYPGGITASSRRSAQRHLRTTRSILPSTPDGVAHPFCTPASGTDADAISRKDAPHGARPHRTTRPSANRPLLESLARPSSASRCKPRFDLMGALQTCQGARLPSSAASCAESDSSFSQRKAPFDHTTRVTGESCAGGSHDGPQEIKTAVAPNR
ncbi:hypothetical protein Enr13x_39270 [Stieleria neptunia]|uniref:Uncharacterized protein n=1 Tax=Stieleria neptunia TaxID=2527979 RepID=A0A518HTA1_9BACT|nr:hypothetical protein Enr13x_39270 [Stieleria neptunia]